MNNQQGPSVEAQREQLQIQIQELQKKLQRLEPIRYEEPTGKILDTHFTSAIPVRNFRAEKLPYIGIRWVVTDEEEDEPWIEESRERLTFDAPSTYWIVGIRHTGKSTLAELIAMLHLWNGATVFDIYSSEDNESLAWLRTKYSVLLVCGDSKDLITDRPWVRVSELTLQYAEQFDVVVTCPSFFQNDYERYSAISTVVEMLRKRTGWLKKVRSSFETKVDVLLIREASEFLTSRIVSGKAKTRMEAEWDFIRLLYQAFHTGLALIVDALRPLSVDVNIRELATYTFIKRMGKMRIPDEFGYVISQLNVNWIRRMRTDEFGLYTESDNVGYGVFEEVPFHVMKGEDMLVATEVRVKDHPKEEKKEVQPPVTGGGQPLVQQAPPSGEPKRQAGAPKKVTPELHRQIIALRNSKEGGMSYGDICNSLPVKISPLTVSTEYRDHKGKRCACFAGTVEAREEDRRRAELTAAIIDLSTILDESKGTELQQDVKKRIGELMELPTDQALEKLRILKEDVKNRRALIEAQKQGVDERDGAAQ